MSRGKHQDLTVTLHVVVENLSVIHGDEAEVRVVTLFGDVARSLTGVYRRSQRAAVALGSLERLNESGQIHSFT